MSKRFFIHVMSQRYQEQGRKSEWKKLARIQGEEKKRESRILTNLRFLRYILVALNFMNSFLTISTPVGLCIIFRHSKATKRVQ